MPVNAGKVDSAGREKRGETGLRDKLIPAGTIVLVLALTVVLFLFRDRVTELNAFGYAGLFLVSLIFNASIFLPMPMLPVVAVLGLSLNPVLVAVVAAVGGSLGEMSGYAAGYSGRGILNKNEAYYRAERVIRKWGLPGVFLFAVLPIFPFDLAGLVAGAAHLRIWKFLLAAGAGKIILYGVVAYAGAWSWEAILKLFGG